MPVAILLGLAVSLIAGVIACLLADAARWSLTRRAAPTGRCSNCEYSLAGLSSPAPVCPECGTPATKGQPSLRQLARSALLWPLAIGPTGVISYICLSPEPTPGRTVALLLWLTWPHAVVVGVLMCAGWRRVPRLAKGIILGCALGTALAQTLMLSGPVRGIPGDPAYGIDFDFQVSVPLGNGLLALANCGLIGAVSLVCLLAPRFERKNKSHS
jgi:hypothetical protein